MFVAAEQRHMCSPMWSDARTWGTDKKMIQAHEVGDIARAGDPTFHFQLSIFSCLRFLDFLDFPDFTHYIPLMTNLALPLTIIALIWTICGIGDAKQSSVAEPGNPPAGNQSAANQATASAPAQDRESVKKELVSLANRITTAAKDGDISYLSSITTEDFQLTDLDGKIKTKNKALAEVKEERVIKDFDITDETLVTLDGNTAVLTYTLKVYAKNGRSARAGTTDTYVRQNGRWLLKSEQQTLLK